jgi:hypothetical protein
MKYDSNLIHYQHWGGGETRVYEVEDYRAVFNIFTGSYMAFFRKEDCPEKLEPGYWPFGKGTLPGFTEAVYVDPKPISTGWDFSETIDECVDRHLDHAKYPDSHIAWYEKSPSKPVEGMYYPYDRRLFFSHDNSEENKVRIKSNPLFMNWHDDYWKQVKKDNERRQ